MRRHHKERPSLTMPFDRPQPESLPRAITFFLVVLTLALVIGVRPDGASAAGDPPSPVTSVAAQQSTEQSDKLMLDEPVQDLPVVADARWSSRWTDETPVATGLWVLLLLMLSIVGRPLARVVFASFPDAGQGFTRLLILLVAGWGVWFAASFEIIAFRAIWAWYTVLATVVIGWLLARSRFRSTGSGGSTRAVLGAEAAFWVVFLIFLAFRFVNPDSWHPIWGGEKPMEFAHINALLRTPYFPAFDPWFSGGILNYYYYGEYLVAFLIKLTGIPSEIAFNLAQPTFMGLAASAMYSVVAAIAHRCSRDRVDPLIAGGLGVLLFVLIGNLVSAWTLIRTFPERPIFTFDWTWNASRAIDGGITEFPYFTGLYADLHAHLIALPVTLLVIGLGFALATEDGTITAAIPKLALLSLSLGTLSAANAWDVPVYAVLAVAAVFLWAARFGPIPLRAGVTLLVSAMVGLVAYVMLRPFHEHFVALFNELGRVTRGTDPGQFAWHMGGLLGILGIAMFASGLLSWSPVNRRWRNVAVVVFMLAVVGATGWQVRRSMLEQFPAGSSETVILALICAGALAMVLLRARLDAYVASIAIVVGVIGMAYLAAIGWAVLAIGLMLAVCGALVYFSFDDRAIAFFGLLLAAVGSLIAGVELVFVVDDLASLPDWYRMNTVFKLYYEVWTMTSLLAAVALAVLVSRKSVAVMSWIPTPRGFVSETQFRPAPRTTQMRFAIGACVVLIALSLVYPAVATIPRLDQRFPGHPIVGSLDALDWMNYGTLQGVDGHIIRFDGDLAAIRWFQDHVDGTPVIAEASIGPYRGNGSRFSIALGLPTVLGWDRHERQQRYYPEIAERDQDVHDLYVSGSIERKREIIERYRIRYIIVGDVERWSAWPENPSRPYASAEGLAALQAMVGTDLEIAFEQNGTVVYRVIG